MTEYNHLRLKGIGQPTDEEYCTIFDVPMELANTPDVNESYIMAQEKPDEERKKIDFFYALNGLRDEVKKYKENEHDGRDTEVLQPDGTAGSEH